MSREEFVPLLAPYQHIAMLHFSVLGMLKCDSLVGQLTKCHHVHPISTIMNLIFMCTIKNHHNYTHLQENPHPHLSPLQVTMFLVGAGIVPEETRCPSMYKMSLQRLFCMIEMRSLLQVSFGPDQMVYIDVYSLVLKFCLV